MVEGSPEQQADAFMEALKDLEQENLILFLRGCDVEQEVSHKFVDDCHIVKHGDLCRHCRQSMIHSDYELHFFLAIMTMNITVTGPHVIQKKVNGG